MYKSKLADVKVYKEGDKFYLYLEYDQEDDNKITKLVIPKARLDLFDDPDIKKLSDITEVNIGVGLYLPLEVAPPPFIEDNKLVKCSTHWNVLIKEKKPPKEMTIEEIEKVLGHKVKIVGDENKRWCGVCKHRKSIDTWCKKYCKDGKSWELEED